MKVLILAAGYGTRLRPFTEHTPKALFPLRGRPLLENIIQDVIRAGGSEILINTHHLAHRIEHHVATHDYPIIVRTRHEPLILGTGGAVKAAAALFGHQPFMVINSDIFTDIDLAAVVRFHTAHKFLLLAHSPKDYSELGRVVADAKSLTRSALRTTYENQFMSALSKRASRAKNTNVLQHILGFFKKDLDGVSRQELLGHIQDYRRGLVPLVVPLTLIAHYVRLLDVAYLRDQVYLNPHPKELALRNHV